MDTEFIGGRVLGVLGGGQLGRMMAQAAAPLGIQLRFLDPNPKAPVASTGCLVEGSFKDPDAIKDLAREVDVLTAEIEHIDVTACRELAKGGKGVEPNPETFATIQDKFLQKELFNTKNLPTPEFKRVDSLKDLNAIVAEWGLPLVLKSRLSAYDGKGNCVLRSQQDIAQGYQQLNNPGGLYVEKMVDFDKELAVMVARNASGEIACYPVVETVQKDNICHQTLYYGPMTWSDDARALAAEAISHFQGAGIFGVELFLTKGGSILLNEIAPRPHNSGHYTIEACYSSQFEQHVRCVMGLPMGDPSPKVKAAVMHNILCQKEGPEGWQHIEALRQKTLATPGASFHWYGKDGLKLKRKIGHITIVGDDPENVAASLAEISKFDSF